jgi:hypothetical protein
MARRMQACGLGEATAQLQVGGVVAGRVGDLGVAAAEGRGEPGEHAAVDPVGLVPLFAEVEDRGEGGLVGERVGVVGAEVSLAELDGAARVRLGPLGVAGGVVDAAEVVLEGRMEQRARGVGPARGDAGAAVGGEALGEPRGVLARHAEGVEHGCPIGRGQLVGDLRGSAGDLQGGLVVAAVDQHDCEVAAGAGAQAIDVTAAEASQQLEGLHEVGASRGEVAEHPRGGRPLDPHVGEVAAG